MLSDEQIQKWIEIARRDDWYKLLDGSDIRIMLGELQRARSALQKFAAVSPVQSTICEIENACEQEEGA